MIHLNASFSAISRRVLVRIGDALASRIGKACVRRAAGVLGLGPELVGYWNRINLDLLPPRTFVAAIGEGSVMNSAERHRELVADLLAQSSRLGEPKVVSIARRSPAQQTRL
jgi:hypothetical protein